MLYSGVIRCHCLMTGERDYDGDKYFSNSVVRLMIDDHNVPPLRGMVTFVDDVQKWMDEDRRNVIAIHCKGSVLLALVRRLHILLQFFIFIFLIR